MAFEISHYTQLLCQVSAKSVDHNFWPLEHFLRQWHLSRGTSRLLNRMELQREIRTALYWKENNYLITACKPLSWNLCHVGPFQTWNFLRVPNTYFSRWKYRLNTAVDSDVGYGGAEFNSVCCKYSQSPEFFFNPIWIRVCIICPLYLSHVKCDF